MMKNTYVAIFDRGDDGSWGAYVPDLPGCTSWGASGEDAGRNVRDAIETYIDGLREMNQPIPEPGSFTEIISLS